jgi:AbrB family looped-hinge helix DNA binding protein
MATKTKDQAPGCSLASARCNVEAMVSVDERGQMVLPKDVRDKARIGAGDKLAVISWQKDGEVCCLALLRVENLTDIVRERLRPVVREIF